MYEQTVKHKKLGPQVVCVISSHIYTSTWVVTGATYPSATLTSRNFLCFTVVDVTDRRMQICNTTHLVFSHTHSSTLTIALIKSLFV